MIKVVFIANSKKRYRYYGKIAAAIGSQIAVKFSVYPSLALFTGIFKKLPINANKLLTSHLKRQQINYPWLTKYKLLWRLYCYFALLTEKARFNHYYQLFGGLDCQAVAIWNGQKQPYLTMVEAAKFAKKRVLFLENGLLPHTTTVDYQGVNAANSLPRDPAFYLNFAKTHQQYHQSSPANTAAAAPDAAALAATADQQAIQLQIRDPHKQRRNSGQKLDQLPASYIFIPFQVPADSQIVIHSPWVHSMEQMYQLIVNGYMKLQHQRNPDDQQSSANERPLPTLVFKEHPSWPGHFRHLYQQHDFCLFANENNTQDLIEGADAVITINSTVGLEALLLGKKVLTLGRACYNIDQLVLHAKNVTEFNQCFAQLADWQFDESLRLAFLDFISQHYCISGDWQTMLTNPNTEHFDQVFARIFEQDLLAKAISAASPTANDRGVRQRT